MLPAGTSYSPKTNKSNSVWHGKFFFFRSNLLFATFFAGRRIEKLLGFFCATHYNVLVAKLGICLCGWELATLSTNTHSPPPPPPPRPAPPSPLPPQSARLIIKLREGEMWEKLLRHQDPVAAELHREGRTHCWKRPCCLCCPFSERERERERDYDTEIAASYTGCTRKKTSYVL